MLKNKIKLLFLVIIISCLIFPSIQGEKITLKNAENNSNTFYVNDDYSSSTPGWQVDHFDTIQDAIDASDTYDIIFVYNGIYNERISIYQTIDLIGENKTNVIIDGGASKDVVTISAKKIYMTKFTVKNSGKKFGNSVFNISSSGNIIKNILILCDDLTQNNMGFNILPDANNNTITENEIYNSDIGFEIQSSNNTIKNNIIRDCGMHSIFLHTEYENRDKMCSNNEICNNTIYEIGEKIGWGYGIWLHASIGNKIEGNSIEKKYCCIHIEVSSHNNIITKNNFSNNRGYGIGIASSSDCNISYNNVANNREFGIGFSYRPNHDNIVYHNNLIDNNLNCFARQCHDIKWVENYYSDWMGLRFEKLSFLPYWIPKGTRLNGRIKIPRFSFSNFDWHPAIEPYDI